MTCSSKQNGSSSMTTSLDPINSWSTPLLTWPPIQHSQCPTIWTTTWSLQLQRTQLLDTSTFSITIVSGDLPETFAPQSLTMSQDSIQLLLGTRMLPISDQLIIGLKSSCERLESILFLSRLRAP